MSGGKKRKLGVVKIAGIAVAVLIVLIIALPFLVDANQFRPRLESELTGALGRQVTVGNLKLSLLSGGIAADDITIADDAAFSRSPFVRAKSLRVGVELWQLLFSKKLRVTGISLDQPEVVLIHSPAGFWNFSTIGGGSSRNPAGAKADNASGAAGGDVSVAELKVTNGRITVIRSSSQVKPRVYEKVDIQARDLSFSSVFPFTLTGTLPGGGSLKLDGKAGPVNATDASLTPISATLAVTHLDVTASGFIDPDSGLAGILDFDGSLTSDGAQIQSKGRARADKLQIVKGGSPAKLPISLAYNLNYGLKNQMGNLDQTKVEFGKAVAVLNGSFDTRGDSTQVKMRLRGDSMPADDLEALLPAFGVTLPKGASLQGGTLNADLLAEGPVDRIVTSGMIGIFNARLAGFDLGSKMAAVAALAGIKSTPTTEIEKLASDLRVAPDGIQASNLQLVVPGLGQLTGDGTVGSNNALDFRMQATLITSSGVIGNLTRMAGNEVSVPFFVRGTTSNPTFIPDAKRAAGELLNSVLGGKGKTGESGKTLGDTLRGLFDKKKK